PNALIRWMRPRRRLYALIEFYSTTVIIPPRSPASVSHGLVAPGRAGHPRIEPDSLAPARYYRNSSRARPPRRLGYRRRLLPVRAVASRGRTAAARSRRRGRHHRLAVELRAQGLVHRRPAGRRRGRAAARRQRQPTRHAAAGTAPQGRRLLGAAVRPPGARRELRHAHHLRPAWRPPPPRRGVGSRP